MNSKRPVIFISSGLLEPKKHDSRVARKHRFLNYGLLCLATRLADVGVPCRVFHGDFCTPEMLAGSLLADNLLPVESPIFLSVPSHLAIPWARRFIAHVKNASPAQLIVVGGRWVTADGGAAVRRYLGPVDLVVYGLADERMNDLLTPSAWPLVHGTDRNPRPPSEYSTTYVDLRYDVVNEFLAFQPSVEVARGCAMGCSFCDEGQHPLAPLRTPEDLARSVQHTIRAYDSELITPYFEASLFQPSRAWAVRAAQLIGQNYPNLKWRCSTRADALTPDLVRLLAAAGLKVLDIGLESASHAQLLAMGKTPDPTRYLRRASEMLKACAGEGLWPKINVLLYAGETIDSIRETLDWLHNHSSYIKGVSANSVTAYGISSVSRSLVERLIHHGAAIASSGVELESSAVRFHLSPTLDYATSQYWIRRFAQLFMDQKAYYDLKQFSYFDRNYTYDQFCEDIKDLSPDALPFGKL